MLKTHICLVLSKTCHAGKNIEETNRNRWEYWTCGDNIEQAQEYLAKHRGLVLVSAQAVRGSERIALDIRSRKSEPSKRAVSVPKDARVIQAKVGDSIPSALFDLVPGLSLSPAGFPLYHERRLFQRTDVPGTLVELGTWHGVRIACRKDGKSAYSWIVCHKQDKAPAHNVAGWSKQTAKQGANLVIRRHRKPD